METQNQDSGEILMNTIVTKVTQHDKKIQHQQGRLEAVEKKMEGIPDHSPAIRELKGNLSALSTDFHNQKFPTEDVRELKGQLKTTLSLLQKPVPSQVEHHHHVPKLLWVTAGLFLLVCLLSMGWIMTASKLVDFRVSDTKYRWLKLTVDSPALASLYQLDSLYLASSDSLQSAVTKQEALRQERLELLNRLGAVNRKLGEGSQTPDKKATR
jgi:hypothetical protein